MSCRCPHGAYSHEVYCKASDLFGRRSFADLLGTADRGRLAPGKLADVIAVPGNPVETIAAIERPSFVMLGGKRIDTALLAG
jgi:alpha-D-ribose 1-methylphosphonate 5-triphosphate diphosphatase PhnM